MHPAAAASCAFPGMLCSGDAVFRGPRAAAHGALSRNVRVSAIQSLSQMHCQSLQCVPITPSGDRCVLLQARLCAPVALTAAAAVLNPIDGFCLATERSSVLDPVSAAAYVETHWIGLGVQACTQCSVCVNVLVSQQAVCVLLCRARCCCKIGSNVWCVALSRWMVRQHSLNYTALPHTPAACK
jgi:hypothetical protein